MDHKKILRQQFLEVVENQIRDNDPPETAQTLTRLKSDGYTKEEAKELISTCVASEMVRVMQSNKPFDRDRYISMLSRLPSLPE